MELRGSVGQVAVEGAGRQGDGLKPSAGPGTTCTRLSHIVSGSIVDGIEAPDERAFASDDPRRFLARFPEGAIIDEVQRVPGLLSYLQGIIDEDPTPGRWILTGSQNLALLESVSQSLAGRTEVLNLLPLTWDEITRFDRPPASLEVAMFSGGYPRVFDRQLDPSRWLRS